MRGAKSAAPQWSGYLLSDTDEVLVEQTVF
jgi:hypothetical protein